MWFDQIKYDETLVERTGERSQKTPKKEKLDVKNIWLPQDWNGRASRLCWRCVGGVWVSVQERASDERMNSAGTHEGVRLSLRH